MLNYTIKQNKYSLVNNMWAIWESHCTRRRTCVFRTVLRAGYHTGSTDSSRGIQATWTFLPDRHSFGQASACYGAGGSQSSCGYTDSLSILIVHLVDRIFSNFPIFVHSRGETLTEETLSFILLSIFYAHETPVSGGEGRALNSCTERVRCDRVLYASFSNRVGRSPEPQLEQRLAHTR